MIARVALGVLAGSAALMTVAAAQETPPQVFQVVTLELSPSTMEAWRAAQAKMAEAAKAANLPAAEVGWWAYNVDNRTILVYPRSRDALFANRQLMQKIRQASAPKADELQQAFGGTQVRVVSNEIVQHVPDLSYTPATDIGPPGGIYVVDVRIAPGQGPAWNEAVRAVNKVRTDAGYPYSVQVYRVRMGEPRTVVVTFFDTREAYFGKNQLSRLLEGKSAGQAAMTEAFQALIKATAGWNSWLASYAGNLSYPPM